MNQAQEAGIAKTVIRRRLDAEAEYIKNKWKDKLIDRYYNANFSTDREGMLR